MEITTEQEGKLQKALESAFPSLDELAMFVHDELGENLQNIAGDTLREKVFNLRQWAEAQGRTEELIRKAHGRNATNLALRTLAVELGLQSSNPSITTTGSIPAPDSHRPPRPIDEIGVSERLRQLPTWTKVASMVIVGTAVIAAIWWLTRDPQSDMPAFADYPNLLSWARAVDPLDLPLGNAACFSRYADGNYAAPEVTTWLRDEGGASEEQIDEWQWREGVYVVFRCNPAQPDETSQIEIIVHKFRGPTAARQVIPYALNGFRLSAGQYRDCEVQEKIGQLVICVLGMAESSPPANDVEAVLRDVREA